MCNCTYCQYENELRSQPLSSTLFDKTWSEYDKTQTIASIKKDVIEAWHAFHDLKSSTTVNDDVTLPGGIRSLALDLFTLSVNMSNAHIYELVILFFDEAVCLNQTPKERDVEILIARSLIKIAQDRCDVGVNAFHQIAEYYQSRIDDRNASPCSSDMTIMLLAKVLFWYACVSDDDKDDDFDCFSASYRLNETIFKLAAEFLVAGKKHVSCFSEHHIIQLIPNISIIDDHVLLQDFYELIETLSQLSILYKKKEQETLSEEYQTAALKITSDILAYYTCKVGQGSAIDPALEAHHIRSLVHPYYDLIEKVAQKRNKHGFMEIDALLANRVLGDRCLKGYMFKQDIGMIRGALDHYSAILLQLAPKNWGEFETKLIDKTQFVDETRQKHTESSVRLGDHHFNMATLVTFHRDKRMAAVDGTVDLIQELISHHGETDVDGIDAIEEIKNAHDIFINLLRGSSDSSGIKERLVPHLWNIINLVIVRSKHIKTPEEQKLQQMICMDLDSKDFESGCELLSVFSSYALGMLIKNGIGFKRISDKPRKKSGGKNKIKNSIAKIPADKATDHFRRAIRFGINSTCGLRSLNELANDLLDQKMIKEKDIMTMTMLAKSIISQATFAGATCDDHLMSLNILFNISTLWLKLAKTKNDHAYLSHSKTCLLAVSKQRDNLSRALEMSSDQEDVNKDLKAKLIDQKIKINEVELLWATIKLSKQNMIKEAIADAEKYRNEYNDYQSGSNVNLKDSLEYMDRVLLGCDSAFKLMDGLHGDSEQFIQQSKNNFIKLMSRQYLDCCDIELKRLALSRLSSQTCVPFDRESSDRLCQIVKTHLTEPGDASVMRRLIENQQQYEHIASEIRSLTLDTEIATNWESIKPFRKLCHSPFLLKVAFDCLAQVSAYLSRSEFRKHCYELTRGGHVPFNLVHLKDSATSLQEKINTIIDSKTHWDHIFEGCETGVATTSPPSKKVKDAITVISGNHENLAIYLEIVRYARAIRANNLQDSDLLYHFRRFNYKATLITVLCASPKNLSTLELFQTLTQLDLLSPSLLADDAVRESYKTHIHHIAELFVDRITSEADFSAAQKFPHLRGQLLEQGNGTVAHILDDVFKHHLQEKAKQEAIRPSSLVLICIKNNNSINSCFSNEDDILATLVNCIKGDRWHESPITALIDVLCSSPDKLPTLELFQILKQLDLLSPSLLADDAVRESYKTHIRYIAELFVDRVTSESDFSTAQKFPDLRGQLLEQGNGTVAHILDDVFKKHLLKKAEQKAMRPSSLVLVCIYSYKNHHYINASFSNGGDILAALVHCITGRHWHERSIAALVTDLCPADLWKEPHQDEKIHEYRQIVGIFMPLMPNRQDRTMCRALLQCPSAK